MWIRVLEVTPQTLERLKDVDLVILQELTEYRRIRFSGIVLQME